jgi:uncharacterized protein (TIGR03083 family)
VFADRPADLAARLLLTERAALLPILRRTPPAGFDRPTVCVGWSVRDVLAHCGSAMTRLADGTMHGFTPDENEVDVAERRAWPLDRVLAELETGYTAAADRITEAGRAFDGVALGEWVHGGDVREALGEPRPYASEGVDDALVLLAERSRLRGLPATRVRLAERVLVIGIDGPIEAELETDVETLVRLCSGRRPDPARFRLVGAGPDRYVMFA